MGYKSIVSTLTAQNATETTKTLVDTITVPQGVSKLTGVATQISASGLTTLEDVTGILELESDDMSPWGGTQQFLLGGSINTVVTSGASSQRPFIWPTNIPVTPGAHIKCSATYNKAQTVNPSTRALLIFE